MSRATEDQHLYWVPLGALLVGLLIALTPLNAWLSAGSADFQQRLLAPDSAGSGALVFDIDNASLDALKPQLGPWPFKRDIYALAVEQLRDAGASAVVLDLLLNDERAGDLALARVIARPGPPVVLAAAGVPHATAHSARAPSANAAAEPAAMTWPAMVLPSPSLTLVADRPPAVGVITTPLDEDGRLRQLTLWHDAQGQRWPAMPLAVLMATQGDARHQRWQRSDVDRAWVAFAPAIRGVHRLPFSRLAHVALGLRSDDGLGELVRGRIVFIGSSAMLADSVMTVNGQLSGTDVLAQSYAAMRDDTLLQATPVWANVALLLVAVAPTLRVWRRGQTKLPRDTAWALVALAVIVGAMLSLAFIQRWVTQPAAPAAVVLAGLALAVLSRQRAIVHGQRRLAQEQLVAVAANEAKSEFLANVSHEVRTPMNAMLGVAELLAETELTPEQRRHVEVFRESGMALQDLINDLLDLSKIEAGRFESDPTPFALQAALNRVSSLMRPRAQLKGLAFDIVLEPGDDLHSMVGDRKRLEQALLNLLGNAIKFTAQGVVSLRVSRDTAEPVMVRFVVSDSGIGIAPSKLEAVFEPFAQADHSVTRHYGGTGLGLTITRNMAELLGGGIVVRSTPGLGSEFELRLPMPPVAPIKSPATSAAQPIPAAPVRRTEPLNGLPTEAPVADGLRLLLAEDNEINVYIFESMLAGRGLHIDVATNGLAALELARSGQYDLVFLDVQMPGKGGLAVARELRLHEAATGRARVPLVALTANAFASDVQASLDAGCDRHMTKPFSKAQLLDALETLAVRTTRSVVTAPLGPQPTVAVAPVQSSDRAAALARMGDDEATFGRICAHAAVFMQQWSPSFESARQGRHAERMRALAHDLKGIAATVGATGLAAAAARLQASLESDDKPDDSASALADVEAALAPAIVALTLPTRG